MNDHDLLLAIRDLLDETVWTPDIVEQIARLLTVNGYTLRDRKGIPRKAE